MGNGMVGRPSRYHKNKRTYIYAIEPAFTSYEPGTI